MTSKNFRLLCEGKVRVLLNSDKPRQESLSHLTDYIYCIFYVPQREGAEEGAPPSGYVGTLISRVVKGT